MKKILAYIFAPFPYFGDLPHSNVAVFSKINDDIEIFCHRIIRCKPSIILGIAKSNNNYSTIEKYTVNKFNKNKKVIQQAPDIYELDIPKSLNKFFQIREDPTDSFCNLSAFKIKHFLEINQINIPLTFVHVVKDDIIHLKKDLLK